MTNELKMAMVEAMKDTVRGLFEVEQYELTDATIFDEFFIESLCEYVEGGYDKIESQLDEIADCAKELKEKVLNILDKELTI